MRCQVQRRCAVAGSRIDVPGRKKWQAMEKGEGPKEAAVGGLCSILAWLPSAGHKQAATQVHLPLKLPHTAHLWCPWLSANRASRSSCRGWPAAAVGTSESSSSSESIASAQPYSAAAGGCSKGGRLLGQAATGRRWGCMHAAHAGSPCGTLGTACRRAAAGNPQPALCCSSRDALQPAVA